MSQLFDVVAVAPNTAIDSYYVLSKLELGEVNRATQVLHTAGGKGNNLARAVKMLGGQVLSLGIVGGSSGQFILDELAREGIAADMVPAALESRRTVTLPIAGSGETTVVIENGAPAGEEARTMLAAAVLEHAADTPVIVFTGSIPPDFPDDFFGGLISQLKACAVRTAVDCAGAPLALAIQAGPGIVKVNVLEFLATFGLPNWDWRRAAELSSSLHIDLLIVTDGANGAWVFSREAEPFRVATALDSWVNTTGAGDTFMAGLLLMLNQDKSLEQAVSFASAAAAASLQHVVSGFLDSQDVEKYLRRTRAEKLRSGNL
jgi:1-phosphofructokinase family hexose kinase